MAEHQLNLPEVKSTRGGKRAGAGRPKGTTRAEPSKAMRVPMALVPEIEEMIKKHKAKQ